MLVKPNAAQPNPGSDMFMFTLDESAGHNLYQILTRCQYKKQRDIYVA